VGMVGGERRTMESAVTVSLLRLHLPVDKPESVLYPQPKDQYTSLVACYRMKKEDLQCGRGSIQDYSV
jgi:hypothetical protein